jgi:capsular exopolysaccharide synthesis family protein
LDSIGQKVQSYKTGTGSSDISVQGQLYLQSVSQNDQELGKINMDLAVLEQVQQSLNTTQGSGASMMPSVMGLADNNLVKLMTDLNNKELEYQNKIKTMAENHPTMLALKDQINKIKPQITANLQSHRNNLVASKSKLGENIGKYNSMLSTLPQREKDILEMSRDLKAKQDNYDFLINKMFESKNSIENTLSDVKVVNRAEATKYPVSPNKMFIYAGALMAAFIFGLLFVTAKEGLSRKVLYRKDLEAMTAVPVLGEIAFKRGKNERIIVPGERSMIAEEFRKIRVALHFLGINEEKKKILVTSSIPGEGKSFVAANLAISNALAGKKVVLVDADLHKPGLGKIFDKSTQDAGLSDYLMGNRSLSSIIGALPDYPNLSFVSSGMLHDSPSELLLNKKIAEFIATLDQQFDLIIIDTAPSVLITDAFVLSELVDATLYVVRHKYTPKLVIKRLDENLEINELKNPAIVFNGVKKRGFVKNNYGYGYNYVYGGKYGNEKQKIKQKK